MRPPVEAKRQMPEPATFQMSGKLSVNLTPELSTQTGLPKTISGTLEANARSEAISVDPPISRHQGHMKLTLTDGTGQRSLTDLEITVSGESAGSPTDGLGKVLEKFLDAAGLITRPVTQPSGSA